MTTEDDMTAIFHALAHETRRRIMDVLKLRPGIGVGELALEFDVTRIAVMNHLAVLEGAGLVVSQKEGRTRRLHLNTAPIQMINDRWLDDFSSHWARKLTGIKYAAEAAHAQNTKSKTKRGQDT
jgi:DNA-binding transcriptional ArsR family regulator